MTSKDDIRRARWKLRMLEVDSQELYKQACHIALHACWNTATGYLDNGWQDVIEGEEKSGVYVGSVFVPFGGQLICAGASRTHMLNSMQDLMMLYLPSKRKDPEHVVQRWLEFNPVPAEPVCVPFQAPTPLCPMGPPVVLPGDKMKEVEQPTIFDVWEVLFSGNNKWYFSEHLARLKNAGKTCSTHRRKAINIGGTIYILHPEFSPFKIPDTLRGDA